MKFLVPFFLVLSGCATTLANTDQYYEPPSFEKVKNEVVLESDFNSTWDDLVGDLSKTFYVINNIDKESRLLNVSFSVTEGISGFVDCGVTERRFQLASRNEDVRYDVADPSEYFINSATQTNQPNTMYLHYYRRPILEGRANIYIAPQKDGKTKVMVNARYSWKFRGEFDGWLYMPLYDSHRRLENQLRIRDDNIGDPLSFNTNQLGGDGQGDSVQCISTGKFERDILNLVSS